MNKNVKGVLSVVLTLSSVNCTFVTMTRPELISVAGDEQLNDCTTTYTSPILDAAMGVGVFAIMALGAVGPVATTDPEPSSEDPVRTTRSGKLISGLVGLAGMAGISIYGVTQVNKCIELREKYSVVDEGMLGSMGGNQTLVKTDKFTQTKYTYWKDAIKLKGRIPLRMQMRLDFGGGEMTCQLRFVSSHSRAKGFMFSDNHRFRVLLDGEIPPFKTEMKYKKGEHEVTSYNITVPVGTGHTATINTHDTTERLVSNLSAEACRAIASANKVEIRIGKTEYRLPKSARMMVRDSLAAADSHQNRARNLETLKSIGSKDAKRGIPSRDVKRGIPSRDANP